MKKKCITQNEKQETWVFLKKQGWVGENDPCFVNEQGDTALTFALNNEYPPKTIQSLLEMGCDPNPMMDEGHCILTLVIEKYWAQAHAAKKIVKMLLEAGATPNWENPMTGETAMMSAVKHGVDCIKDVVKFGGDINHRDQDGETLFFWIFPFCDEGQALVWTKRILQLKPDLSGVNELGKSIIDQAQEYFPSMAQLLQDYLVECEKSHLEMTIIQSKSTPRSALRL